MKRNINWVRAAMILLVGTAVIAAGFWLGRSPFGFVLGAAHAQTRITLPPSLQALDRVTYVMPLTEGHTLCWGDGNPDSIARTIRFYRYRVEGGPKQLYLSLDRSVWVPGAPTNFCSAGTHKVPKAGHWVYEAEICYLPVAADGSNCSIRVSAACPAGSSPECAGGVGDTPRGWWVYAYLPAPTGPVVD